MRLLKSSRILHSVSFSGNDFKAHYAFCIFSYNCGFPSLFLLDLTVDFLEWNNFHKHFFSPRHHYYHFMRTPVSIFFSSTHTIFKLNFLLIIFSSAVILCHSIFCPLCWIGLNNAVASHNHPHSIFSVVQNAIFLPHCACNVFISYLNEMKVIHIAYYISTE